MWHTVLGPKHRKGIQEEFNDARGSHGVPSVQVSKACQNRHASNAFLHPLLEANLACLADQMAGGLSP